MTEGTEPCEAGSGRARVTVGVMDGGSIWDAGRRLLASQTPSSASWVAVELSVDPASARVQVSTGAAEPTDTGHVPVGRLGDVVLQHAPAAALLRVPAERAAGDGIRAAVAAWVEAGIDVALLGDDWRVCDSALVGLAGLETQVAMGPGANREAAWGTLTDLVGDLVTPHRQLVEKVVATNAPLAMLLATVLEPWLGHYAVTAEVVEDALSTALARYVHALARNDTERAFAVVNVLVGGGPALPFAARSLGLPPDRAQKLRHALTQAGFGGVHTRRRDLTVSGLFRLLPRETTQLAVDTVSEVLVHADLDSDICVEVLRALHNETGQEFIALVYDTVTSVPPAHRRTLLARLLPALADGSDDPVRTVAGHVRSSRVDAQRAPIRAAAGHPRLTDPLEGGSLLVSLEHPVEVAAWAERTLAAPEVDDEMWARAMMTRWIVGRSVTPRFLRGTAGRRGRLPPPLRRLLHVVHTAMSAFTTSAQEDEILGMAAQAVDLELHGWPTDVGCLVAAACLAVDDRDLADRWTWLVRARSDPGSLDHACAQLLKAFCELARGQVERARDNADPAGQALDRLGAHALAAVASSMSALCAPCAGPAALPPVPVGGHVMLASMQRHFAARIALREGHGLDTVDDLFDIGRRLRTAGLSNPGLVRWREQLIRLFEVKGESQIAACLRIDLRRAEAHWAEVNPRSAARRQGDGDPVAAEVAVDAPGLDLISTSEMRVIERVIAGDTNREAASALFLSKRTVDTHLRNVYRRLGISSRDELRNLMALRLPGLAHDREDGVNRPGAAPPPAAPGR